MYLAPIISQHLDIMHQSFWCVWVLYSSKWCHGIRGLCTKNDINRKFWAPRNISIYFFKFFESVSMSFHIMSGMFLISWYQLIFSWLLLINKMLFHLLQNIFYGLNMKFLELHSTEAFLPQRKHYIAKNNYHNIHVFVCFLFLPMHFMYLSYIL